MYTKIEIIVLFLFLIRCYCEIPTVTFNNGVKIPILGLGTSRSKPNEIMNAVRDAIDIGYRHFDCAYHYFNENEIGQVIAEKINEGVVKREDLFVTSKLWNTFHKPENVEKALKISLTDLRLEYVDLYLIHFPMGYKEDNSGYSDDDYVDTWLAMEQVYKKGLARAIGISNFNKKQIERVLERATVVPVTNQVECHPYLNQQKLIDFCASKNITVIAHTPLARAKPLVDKPNVPILLENPKIKTIANKFHKSVAQIILRYQIQRGVIVIPKSVNKNRINENFQIFDFKLSAEDMDVINGLDVHGRIALISENNNKYYPFHDEY